MLTHRQLATSGIPWSAHVSAIIEGDNWKTREGNLQTIWASLPAYKPDPHKEDQIIWSQHGTGKFSIATAWELIRHHSPAQDTHLLIWQKEHIPRHAFILWLAVQGRLRTRDRISTITAIPSLLCALCNQEPETHDHLFFRCHHSRTVWETVNRHAGLTWPSLPWNQLTDWAIASHKCKKNVTSMIARLSLAASVYNIWQERNRRIFSHQFQGTDYLASEIIQVSFSSQRWTGFRRGFEEFMVRERLEDPGLREPLAL
ncbi:hypothetical protein OIU76_002137 [Salix suchowensis]|nr:hypothetical protein OIU76_002137 [Salix suchowensis]